MTVNVAVGNSEYGDPSVLPYCPLTLSNGDQTALAGEIVASGPFFGLLQNDAADGDLRGLTVHQLMRIKKYTGATHSFAKGDPITLKANPTATKNDYWAHPIAAGEPIHGYALEVAAVGDTSVLIIGPLLPPFAVHGTMADILAAIATATAGQVVIADGTGGVGVTDWTVPTADGVTGQVLKQSGANALGFANDEDALTALVAGKAAGQVVVAGGANDATVTLWHLPTADGANGTILKTNGALGVTWSADA